MSVAPTPRGASRRRLLFILLAAVVVVLVGIAVAVSAPGPSAPEPGADRPAATTPPASASPTKAAAKPADAELLDEANTVCEMRVTEKYPTAEVQPGTKSTAKAKSGTFETTGTYTDPSAGKTSPAEFLCSSVNSSGSWTVNLVRG